MLFITKQIRKCSAFQSSWNTCLTSIQKINLKKNPRNQPAIYGYASKVWCFFLLLSSRILSKLKHLFYLWIGIDLMKKSDRNITWLSRKPIYHKYFHYRWTENLSRNLVYYIYGSIKIEMPKFYFTVISLWKKYKNFDISFQHYWSTATLIFFHFQITFHS